MKFPSNAPPLFILQLHQASRKLAQSLIRGIELDRPLSDAILEHGEVIGKLIPKLKPGGVLGSVLGKPKEAEGKPIRVEAFMATPDASLLRQMADAVRDRKLVIPIARTMRLSEAAEAQAVAEKGSVRGKILLIP